MDDIYTLTSQRRCSLQLPTSACLARWHPQSRQSRGLMKTPPPGHIQNCFSIPSAVVHLCTHTGVLNIFIPSWSGVAARRRGVSCALEYLHGHNSDAAVVRPLRKFGCTGPISAPAPPRPPCTFPTHRPRICAPRRRPQRIALTLQRVSGSPHRFWRGEARAKDAHHDD